MEILRIILASASPRRHELLDLAGIKHEIVVPRADETSVKYIPGRPREYVMELSAIKSRAVSDQLNKAGLPKIGRTVIISADTIVYCPDTDLPLGKPKGREDAFRMLTLLSGSTHQVITGVTLCEPGKGQTDTFFATTLVTFRVLDDEEITEYINTGEPMDKAGSYGIQGRACSFAERIEGDYYNIVGLPLSEIVPRLKRYRDASTLIKGK